ncbi:L,D-transpeptidase [Pseudogemmobacter sonorensis]|uniref:L,D-transpeptidase n=1 Tax=Pseudogemmobacter sonorensis TaxID=2989681 RepID=UPI0036BD6FBE
MTLFLPRLSALAALVLLAACGPKPRVEAPPAVTVPGYEAVQDGNYLIPGIDPMYLREENRRAEVEYTAGDAPGTIVVDVYVRQLYLVLEGGRALRYAIAVGREGTSFRGNGYIGRKAEWPSWTPTANMIRTQPEMYAEFAGGLPGGLENPLGSRALYLYRGGRDTMFRIHGTVDPASIGRATSAGCIRLFNQDVMDLYERVGSGAQVKVRTLEESIAIEGPYMDDAWGRAVPETPENIARKERELVERAEIEARQAAEAEARAEAERIAVERAAAEAERERLRQCRRQRISAEDCPPSVVVEI